MISDLYHSNMCFDNNWTYYFALPDAQKMLPISNGTDEDATFNFRSGSPVT